MLQGIHHAGFTVSDMERSIAFYRDLLGFKVLWDSKAAGVRFTGPVSDAINECAGTEQRIVFAASGVSYIELIEGVPAGKPLEGNKTTAPGSSHVCFNTDNIGGLFERLSKNNVRLHCSPQNIGFGHVLYFRDPDGIILEAFEGEFPF